MMAQAILTFSPHNGWSVSLSYRDKKVAHWVMQVVGAILATTGSIIRISNIATNFQSPHGILGLIAMILTFISLIGGAINLYTKKTVFTTIIHSCAGSLTLAAAFLALCLGFDKFVFRNVMGDTVANLSIALTAIGLVGTLMQLPFPMEKGCLDDKVNVTSLLHWQKIKLHHLDRHFV
ncbi:hypothetical protein MSG28_016211 [Choristoneura fumiferana]|uniref:Uncharacterized protein n=1 Tax=Choristoneura fumiferana TaxID=7141 RepID=A0ACC0K6X4_CHOFU|nr:hypothetical protein MSG28_016211 [Choristoneura fumiferana]